MQKLPAEQACVCSEGTSATPVLQYIPAGHLYRLNMSAIVVIVLGQ
jgi:hypothetical protein